MTNEVLDEESGRCIAKNGRCRREIDGHKGRVLIAKDSSFVLNCDDSGTGPRQQ